LSLAALRAFAYRVLALGLRFGCPLLILAMSTPEMMGKYYLFIAYFTFVVFLIAMETAIPFSRKYLRQRNESRRRSVFTSFVASQFVLSLVLAVPATGVFFLGASGPVYLMALFLAAVISEACVNEVGRFFWNIGQVDTVSRRDFLRAVIFVIAMAASVMVSKEVVTATSLGTIATCNAILLVREMRVWGAARQRFLLFLRAPGSRFRSVMTRVRLAVRESLPQVVHLQIMALQPLLERLVIDQRVGAELVGSYSFQYSVVQAGASLFLLPVVAATRRAILSATDSTQWGEAHGKSLRLLAHVFALTILLAGISHFALPVVAVLLGKTISSSVMVIMAAQLAAAAATYATAISPLYAKPGRLWRANLAALFSMLPLFVLFFTKVLAVESQEAVVTIAIMITSVAQIAIRICYVVSRP
jgi:hypothetical protein